MRFAGFKVRGNRAARSRSTLGPQQRMRDIGPAIAGSSAFLSSAIAVSVGAVLAGKTTTLLGTSGMVLMLVAAGVFVCRPAWTPLFTSET
jgi:hypothetical protein